MKIGFHTHGLSLRGTEIALYDYALHNQSILNNESVIFYKRKNGADPQVLEKFQKHFQVIPYEGNEELSRMAEQEKVDLVYFIKSGEKDGDILNDIPSAIHAVFPTKPAEFHGDKFAFVSQWLSKEYSNNQIPYVPHMIHLPELKGNLKEELRIPQEATVMGCYGGSDSFNLSFVHKTVNEVLDKRKDIYFLFMNIAPFATHERLIFLPGNALPDYKVRFINTCDAMLHARGIGESFGLACGEFSTKNKPVLTYAMSPQRSHIEIMQDKCIQYKGPKDLKEILLSIDQNTQHEKIWDAYSESYSPKPIMAKFAEVFLGPNTKLELNRYDLSKIQGFRFLRKLRNIQKKLYV